MPIEFLEAADHHIGSYFNGVLPAIEQQIQVAIDAVDAVLPGIREVMVLSSLGIVYDNKNNHGLFESSFRGHRGAYYWPLHKLYLGDSGIKKSVAHESAHMLDILAGPSLFETQEKYGKKFVWARSLYSFFPKGGKILESTIDTEFNQEENFMGWFLMNIFLNHREIRGKRSKQDALFDKFLSVDFLDLATQNFVTERIAHLMEEFVYTMQVEQKLKPLLTFANKKE